MLGGFWLLRVEWGGGLSESVKKGKFVAKIFFQIVLNKFLKTCDK